MNNELWETAVRLRIFWSSKSPDNRKPPILFRWIYVCVNIQRIKFGIRADNKKISEFAQDFSVHIHCFLEKLLKFIFKWKCILNGRPLQKIQNGISKNAQLHSITFFFSNLHSHQQWIRVPFSPHIYWHYLLSFSTIFSHLLGDKFYLTV